MTSRMTLISAVASVALALTATVHADDTYNSSRTYNAGPAKQAPTALEGYADYNPNNDVRPSTFNSQRGGTLKPADPRPVPGTDPTRSARPVYTETNRSRMSSDRYDNAGQAGDRQAPVENRVVAPAQSDTSSQTAVNRNMQPAGTGGQPASSDGVNWEYIRPADPAVVMPDVRDNGGVDRVLAGDRALANRVVPQQTVPATGVAVRDVSTHPIDSLNDPAFRQPTIAADTAGRTDSALPAGDRTSPSSELRDNNLNNRPSDAMRDNNLNNRPSEALRDDQTLRNQSDRPAITNVPTPSKGERAPNQITNDRNPPQHGQNGSQNSTLNNNGIGSDTAPVRPVSPRDTTPGTPAPQFSPNSPTANPAGTTVTPPTTIPPTDNPTPTNPGSNVAPSTTTPPATTPPAASSPRSDAGNLQNDATLDLPAIRMSMTKFVDTAVSDGGLAGLPEQFVRSDRAASAGAGTADELDRSIADFRTAWRAKYGSDVRGTNNPLALADGFRIVSPAMADGARLAGERTTPAGTENGTASNGGRKAPDANQINERDAGLKDRPDRSNPKPGSGTASDDSTKAGMVGDHAVVIIPMAAICVDKGANPHDGGTGAVKPRDPNAGAEDRARGAITEGTGKALGATGEATNKVGEEGNRVGDGLNRAGETLKQQGRDLKDRGEASADRHAGQYATVADRKLMLTREDGQWLIDLPANKSMQDFRKELAANLRALTSYQAQWPSEQSEGYRMLAAHILSAAGE